jgi:hypothetical protein
MIGFFNADDYERNPMKHILIVLFSLFLSFIGLAMEQPTLKKTVKKTTYFAALQIGDNVAISLSSSPVLFFVLSDCDSKVYILQTGKIGFGGKGLITGA